MYRERAARAVPGAVLWSWRTEGDAGTGRVLPDGCMDLIWTGGGLLVAGPDTVAQPAERLPGDHTVGLRFAPGTAPAVLGVAAWELRDRRVPLGALWPGAEARVALERVAEADDRAAALEALVRQRTDGPARDPLREAVGDPVRRGVLDGLRRGVGVAGLAAELSLSERQLLRRCQELFGYGPKTLHRVLRLERALAAARAGEPFARVAAGAGYADQAHLAREVRALAGVPLTELLAGP
ncbi:helix-turn-helix domain-containing protein [Streptacidiphilus sp. N1-12]|uniref:Helix-turn-helix domain-containing protein n=2 Tax=Streptacidiphilus alkalitolerans TaxID=3342712 RepID=A0ABV6VA01_9ACTN